MPTDETPRQKKQASRSANCDWMPEKSKKSLWIISRSFGWLRPLGCRTTMSTLSTRRSSRHSSSAPLPTMPVAPKITTFMNKRLYPWGVKDAALKPAALRRHERRLLPGVFGLLVKRIGCELDQLHADVIGIVDI